MQWHGTVRNPRDSSGFLRIPQVPSGFIGIHQDSSRFLGNPDESRGETPSIGFLSNADLHRILSSTRSHVRTEPIVLRRRPVCPACACAARSAARWTAAAVGAGRAEGVCLCAGQDWRLTYLFNILTVRRKLRTETEFEDDDFFWTFSRKEIIRPSFGRSACENSCSPFPR